MSIVIRAPTHAGLIILSPRFVIASSLESNLILRQIGPGRIERMISPAESPKGFYRFFPLDNSRPLFLKVFPCKEISHQVAIDRFVASLDLKLARVSRRHDRGVMRLNKDLALVAHEYVEAKFAGDADDDLFGLGAALSDLHNAMEKSGHAAAIARLSRQRMTALSTAFDHWRGEGAFDHPVVRDWLSDWVDTGNDLTARGRAIHGDLHPANILLPNDGGGPVFLDFEDSLRSWFPASFDLAKLIERLLLVHVDETSEEVLLERADRLLSGYRAYAENIFQIRPGELMQIMQWTLITSLLLVAENVDISAEVMENERQKFIALASFLHKAEPILQNWTPTTA